jgi:alpha-beta hydrolase superfamily lysophospholipase
MTLDHPLISERYFFPRQDEPKQVHIVQCGDVELHCLKHFKHTNAPTLLHFHGNGEVVADYEGQIAEAFSSCGLNVFFAEYRGFGSSTGQAQLEKMLSDLDFIMDALDTPSEQAIVFGRSVGSIYALEAAQRFPNIMGLILESGIADVHQRLRLRIRPEELGSNEREFKQDVQERFDHKAKLSGFEGPLLIMHTEYDGIVDLEHAQHNFAWAKSQNKTLKIFEQGNHNTIMSVNWQDYFQTLQAFVSQTEASRSK